MSKRISILGALVLSACCWSAMADWYSATVTVTNTAGTINGQTLMVNSDVRTWTNSVAVPASQILTNNTRSGAAANLLNQVAVYPFAGMQIMTAPYGFTIRSNAAFTVTLSSGWGAVTSTSITTTNAIIVEMPLSNYSLEQQTNIASALAAAILSDKNTNQLGSNVRGNFATNAGSANFATNAGSANFATNAGSANFATNAGSANFSTNAGNANFATNAGSANFATNAGNANFATNAGNASMSTNAAGLLASAAGPNLVITNGLYYGTNRFAGPTNAIDLALTYQFYSTLTPVQITVISNVVAWQNRTAALRVQNMSSTNVTVYWPVSVSATDGSRSAVVTNGQFSVFTFSAFGNITTNESNATFW